MRLVLYTGKGGVGKTTTAAATAARAAELGKRTLVASADAAHSLGDVLELPGARGVGPRPIEVAPGLDAIEIDARVEVGRHWGRIQDFLVELFRHQGLEVVVAEELALLPGAEEITTLLAVEEFVASGTYDLVVVDCAPTDATLRLVTLPDIAHKSLRVLLPLFEALSGVAVPVLREADRRSPARAATSSGTPTTAEPAAAKAARATRAPTTSVRLVVTPERMVIDEARRAWTELALFEVGCDAIVLNRMLPPEGRQGGLVSRVGPGPGANAIARSRSSSRPIRCWWRPLREDEVTGVDALARHGRELFADAEPDALLSRRTPRVRFAARACLRGGAAAARRRPGSSSTSQGRRRAHGDDWACDVASCACRAASPTGPALSAARRPMLEGFEPTPESADARSAEREPGRGPLMRVLLHTGKGGSRQDEPRGGHGPRRRRARPPGLRALDRLGPQPGRRPGATCRRRARGGGAGRDGPGDLAPWWSSTAPGRKIQEWLAALASRATPRRASVDRGAVWSSRGSRSWWPCARCARSRPRASVRRLHRRLRAHRLDAAHAAAAGRAAVLHDRLLPVAEAACHLGCCKPDRRPRSVWAASWRPTRSSRPSSGSIGEVEDVRQILLDDRSDQRATGGEPRPGRGGRDAPVLRLSVVCTVSRPTPSSINRVLPAEATGGYFASTGPERERARARRDRRPPSPYRGSTAPLLSHASRSESTHSGPSLGIALRRRGIPPQLFQSRRRPIQLIERRRPDNTLLSIDLPDGARWKRST